MYNYRSGLILVTLLIALVALHLSASPSQATSVKQEVQVTETQTTPTPVEKEIEVPEKITNKTNNLDKKIFKLAMKAYKKAHADGMDGQEILTIIDFSKPSTEPRLWVMDLKSHEILFETLVSHGKHTGLLNAQKFSNRPGSEQSSLGLFLTGKTYFGKNGYSMELHGLEEDVNDNALKRRVVMHGAKYATEEFAKTHGYLGRSWGCPALSPNVLKPIINTIKNGTLLFAYYPEPQWLASSSYLH